MAMITGSRGGVAVWLWVLVGAVIGVLAGWWHDDWVTYTLVMTLFGWLTGLSLAQDAEH